MSSLINENGRLSTRSNFVGAPTYSNVTDVVDFTIDSNNVIYCTHQSGRISIGNGITQSYVENATGFATFPFSTNNIGLLYAGQFTSGNTTNKFLATPASSGMMFIQLRFVNATLTGSGYVIDPSLSNAASCNQGLRGVATAASTTDSHGNVTGSGIWEDLVWLTTGGTFAVLNQSTKAGSATPYFIDSMTKAISNNWVIPSIQIGGTRMASPSTGVFVFPYASSAAGSTIGVPSWPNLLPVVVGTRNFTQFTYKANPFAFQSDGMTPLANWNSFAVTGIDSDGSSLTMVSGANYVYSMNVS
jgi:hypothetical protein